MMILQEQQDGQRRKEHHISIVVGKVPVMDHFADAKQEQTAHAPYDDTAAGPPGNEIGQEDRQTRQHCGKDPGGYQDLRLPISKCETTFPSQYMAY